MTRLTYEISISGRREGEGIENAMKGLGRLLPKKFVVLAKRQAMVKDFCEVIGRSPLDAIYIDGPERGRGLKDPTVVRLGHFYENPNHAVIQESLRSMGRITEVDVTDWR